MAERILVVHNTVRRVRTRTTRALAPGRQRFTQRIGGGEIVVKRNRPMRYPESTIRRNLKALRAANEAGALEVRDEQGVFIDLSTLASVAVEPAAVPPNLRPEFPLDSAKKDTNPQRPARLSSNVVEPSPQAQGAVPDLLKPTKEEEAEEAEKVESTQPPPPDPEPTPEPVPPPPPTPSAPSSEEDVKPKSKGKSKKKST